MAELRIRRLAARAPPGRGHITAAQALDAMRLAVGTEDRYLIIRSLALGSIPSTASAAHWHTRADQRLAALRATAVHGGNPGAASAAAVWFMSPAEARRLLLLELAAGRYPHAWFWPLAVPDWRGEDLPIYLAALIRTAEADPATTEFLARTLVPLVAAGALPVLLRALADTRTPHLVPSDEQPAARQHPSPTPHATQALRLLEPIPAPARHVLRRAIADPAGPAPVRHHLAGLMMQAVEPSLAGQPALAEALAAALLVELTPRTEAQAAPPATRPDVAAALPQSGAAQEAAPAQPAPPPTIATVPPHSPARSVPQSRAPQDPSIPPRAVPQAPQNPPVLEPSSQEEPSPLAGLFLLIVPLARLGLPAWLAAHPSPAFIAFPRTLLHHIAARHAAHLKHLRPEDPVLRLLAPPLPAPDLHAHDAWRVGLDRWLRRTTNRRLSELVRRRGWLLAAEDMLTIRYPQDAADIALRRRALDTDPGWLPWLGWSVRFHFRDEPLG